jgi:hypothetical protein
MTDRHQIHNIIFTIEFVDDSVIAGAQSIFRSSFQAMMREGGKARS